MNKKSYQNDYLGMTSFNYDPIFTVLKEYFDTLYNYLHTINTPCLRCNNTKEIIGDCLIIHSFGIYTLLRYGEHFLVSMPFEDQQIFIPVDEQIPEVIREVFTTYYSDVTSDECMPSFTIKGDFMGNKVGFYLDKYQVLTIYQQLWELYLFTEMNISQQKKYNYRKFLYKQSFTFKSKGNCSC